MSPLLGALGDSSEYAYRGNLDDVPNDFVITNLTNINPGVAATTGPITITGINNRVKVTVGAGASIAVNSGIFTGGPSFIEENDQISVLIQTTSGTDADFSKLYATQLTVGKTTKEWNVRTREKDSSPDSFSFTNFTNQELGVDKTSNIVTLSGLESTIPSNASIVSGIGSFSKNGGSPGTADTVGNGDTIQLYLRAPTDYSLTNSTIINVGTYSTTFSVSTRASDTTVDQFTFTDYTNVAISSSFDSNSITLTGADTNTAEAPVPLTASIQGGFLKVVRGTETVRDFTAITTSQTVYNGDVLTLRLNSSPSYSTSTSAILSVTGANTPTPITDTFTVTTRPIISDTIPSQFTFVDKTGQGRNIATISDAITIVGMTTHADDFATAFITTSTDGGEFRVTRGGSVVRGFSTDSYQVRNDDVIELRLTTSPASNGSVQTRFNVSGTDNTDIENIITSTISDTWVVQSAVRNCTLVAPSLSSVTRVEPSTLNSVTFIPTSYDSDCGVVVNTSNDNSYLDVNGSTGNNLTVLPGVACTVYMTAGTFGQTRSTTLTLTANNNLPSAISTSTTWSVGARSSFDPTISISADPSIISCGENTTLTWSTTNTVSLTSEGFTVGVNTSGELDVGPLKKNTTFSITATGPDGTTSTSSASVLVQTTASVDLIADSTDIDYNGSVTLSWASSNADSIVTNFGETAKSGSKTFYNLKSTTTYTAYAKSNSGCADSSEKSVKVNVAACIKTTDTYSPSTGVTLSFTYGDAGEGYAFYYTGLSGNNISNASRQGINNNGSKTYDGSRISAGEVEEEIFETPDGVTSLYAICRGGGGGGGGGGPNPTTGKGGGGGGGGEVSGTISTFPGDYFYVRYGGGGVPGEANGPGNTPNNGGQGSFAGQGNQATIKDSNYNDILRGRGGYGGGRNIGGLGGGAESSTWQPTNGPNINNTGGGTNRIGQSGSVQSGGSNYRRGGNGGNLSQVGNAGQGSYVYISWSAFVEGATWNTLITGINDQYKNSFNRPATFDEMDYWISVYVDYSYDSVSSIKDAIKNSRARYSNSGAIDECGNSI